MKEGKNLNINKIFDEEKLNSKIVEALFGLLYKKDLITRKEYKALISNLSHSLNNNEGIC